ncbi:serine/threonine-protein kinase haspin [Alligator mississippiensis]|uniref:serine/threonine-protein kinase haspin n=1 Tax=Alligator mississippiensis TaxID=8496 RepID=UPI002877DB42|nr:serine/threonine-protein kinase haspin [Alligator mississippiensis]
MAAGGRARLLRTYARRGPALRRLPPAAPCFSPPQDRRRLFSSTSGSDGDDPDYRPPSPRRARPPHGSSPASRQPQRHRHVTRRRRRQGALPVRPPLLCSTPQAPGPAPRRSTRRSMLPELSSLLLLEDGDEDGDGRAEPASLLLFSPDESKEEEEEGGCVPPTPRAPATSPTRCCPSPASPAGAGCPGTCTRRGEGAEGSHQRDVDTCPRQPLVVLDTQAVPLWLARLKSSQKAAPAAPSRGQGGCQPPASPFAPRRKEKGGKVAPKDGNGGTCRKACISGFSSTRWGKQTRLRPVGKNKKRRRQQANGSFFQEQMRGRGGDHALELSSLLVKDYSLLNDSLSWSRARASMSFHKKKKVAAADHSCGSIPCTPSFKSQLARYPKTPFSNSVGRANWPASPIVLLTPMKSHSILEVMLTDAEKVYGECKQEGPVSFEKCIPPQKMKKCKKIGEGVFGEVFQTESERGPVALKIIPIEGSEKVNGEAQKSFSEILPEIIISKELSLLSQEIVSQTVGFIGLYSVHCVQGAYPEHLLKAWDTYHKQTGSENDRPDLFGDQQFFMVLEFEFGGSNLETMKTISSVLTAKSILHQVTASLAVAEEVLCFEHRDLHWGNVLVKKTNVKELSYMLNGTTYAIPTHGVHVSIIDYTLSRLEKDGLTVFCDLSTDEELFQGTGDYQFDIYRKMKEENSNSWSDYHPHSNVLWLHYLADKLLNSMGHAHKPKTSSQRAVKKKLQNFHNEVLNFSSAQDVLHNSRLFQ